MDDQARPIHPVADYVIGHEGYTGRRHMPAPSSHDITSPSNPVYDEVNQRLFISDGRNSRILVFDTNPNKLRDYPEAKAVIGQLDFTTGEPDVGADRLGGGGSLAFDAKNQRLFVADRANARVLVFDVSPGSLDRSGMPAFAVLGQGDFRSRARGIGPDRLAAPGYLAYDSKNERLFVADGPNNRILVFDVAPDRLHSGAAAIGVLGQPDFNSRTPRYDLSTISMNRYNQRITIDFDEVYQRLFLTEEDKNRILVFDADPDRFQNFPKIQAVLGQPDAKSVSAQVSRSRVTMPRVRVDSKHQRAFISEGFPGGNRVIVFDIHPDRLKTGEKAMSVIGHYNDDWNIDFDRRAAQDKIQGDTVGGPRDVALDPIDHRLFVVDHFNHRILVFQLDRENRVSRRWARWVIGRKDVYESRLGPISASTVKAPLPIAYDKSTKRLFVGDGWNNRVLVFDVAPGRIASGMDATAVLGQPDFTSSNPATSQTGFFFDVRLLHGIGPGRGKPVGLTIDEAHQRLFVSDGGNNRVMVFDVDPSRLRNGEPAQLVLGQPDFTTSSATQPGLTSDGDFETSATLETAAATGGVASASEFNDPSELAYDPIHDRLFLSDSGHNRVLVFDATPGHLKNGAAADAVLGQPDFKSTGKGTSPNRMASPDGLSFDPRGQRLFVTGMSNHRVLVFDVNPEHISNGMDAVSVLGQPDFGPVRRPAGDNHADQDELFDPRGTDFDSERERLIVADSWSSRVMIFTFPRSRWKYSMPHRSMLALHTLDFQSDHSKVKSDGFGYAAADLQGGRIGGATIFSLTTRSYDRISQRESRILHSEAALGSIPATGRALLYVGNQSGSTYSLSILNENSVDAAVTLQRIGEGGRRQGNAVMRTIGPGRQLLTTLNDLLGTAAESAVGIEVSSDQPVIVGGVETGGPDEHPIVSPIPAAYDGRTTFHAAVPSVLHGGGWKSRVLFMNPTDEEVRGSFSLLDYAGKPAKFQGQPQSARTFSVAPRSITVWEAQDDSVIGRRSFIKVDADTPAALSVSVQTDRWDGTDLLQRVYFAQYGNGRESWIPVDTRPNMIRHGEKQFSVVVANPNDKPAGMRWYVYDGDGKQVNLKYQILPAHHQREWRLKDFVEASEFDGTLRIISDLPVALAPGLTTINIQDREVMTAIPYFDPGRLKDHAVSPMILDGGGMATHLLWINAGEGKKKMELQMRRPSGQPWETILR